MGTATSARSTSLPEPDWTRPSDICLLMTTGPPQAGACHLPSLPPAPNPRRVRPIKGRRRRSERRYPTALPTSGSLESPSSWSWAGMVEGESGGELWHKYKFGVLNWLDWVFNNWKWQKPSLFSQNTVKWWGKGIQQNTAESSDWKKLAFMFIPYCVETPP